METDKVTEKVYCYDHPSAYKSDNSAMWAALMSQRQESPAEMAAIMNGGMGGQWNNPFIYLVWMMFAQRMWGGNAWGDAANGVAENYNSRQISALQDTINTNHNNDIALQAIQGNATAIKELATTLNCDYNTMSQAICGVKSAVESVGANVGFSAERVINAISQGDAGIMSAVQSCCCNTQKAILEQTNTLGSKIDSNHAADQLQACQYQGATMSRIDQLASGIQQGFAQIGFQASKDTADIIQAGNANTQKIVDTLNAKWQHDLSQALQDEKFKNSQMEQNLYLTNFMRAQGGCPCAN